MSAEMSTPVSRVTTPATWAGVVLPTVGSARVVDAGMAGAVTSGACEGTYHVVMAGVVVAVVGVAVVVWPARKEPPSMDAASRCAVWRPPGRAGLRKPRAVLTRPI